MLRFEWDHQKAESNLVKHGISFELASTVFDDPGALEGYDIAHSEAEDRFIRIGMSDIGVLIVVFTERRGSVLRIITARRANHQEEKLYYENQTH